MDKCNFKQGPLPECAPLALAQTPMQQSNEPAYDRRMALARGTLFPGLDLPFMNMVNKPGDLSTPLCELMAMDFVIRELNLYLDTHPDDREALETLQKCIRLISVHSHLFIIIDRITIDFFPCMICIF